MPLGTEREPVPTVREIGQRLEKARLHPWCYSIGSSLVIGWVRNRIKYPDEFKDKLIILWPQAQEDEFPCLAWSLGKVFISWHDLDETAAGKYILLRSRLRNKCS
ncbi:hypothetical protein KW807_02700 [Candidatus Parcubacteria bacterium]|nr:hypothetical protein [Candidatus Parcubacteria bacterium]